MLLSNATQWRSAIFYKSLKSSISEVSNYREAGAKCHTGHRLLAAHHTDCLPWQLHKFPRTSSAHSSPITQGAQAPHCYCLVAPSCCHHHVGEPFPPSLPLHKQYSPPPQPLPHEQHESSFALAPPQGNTAPTTGSGSPWPITSVGLAMWQQTHWASGVLSYTWEPTYCSIAAGATWGVATGWEPTGHILTLHRLDSAQRLPVAQPCSVLQG